MSHATLQQAGFDPHLYKLPPPADATIENVPGGAAAEEKPPTVSKLVGDDVFYKYRGLIGRGTSLVYPTLSWQLRLCTPEGNIIKLRKRIPVLRDHLADLKYSASKHDLKLLRMQIEERKILPKFEERDLHILSTAMYKKLWEVKSIAEFKQVFIDCVECHYHAYAEGKVLHRDLRGNNLMVWYHKSGDVKGILNDWDMASKLNEEEQIPLSGVLHRTGTQAVPFMARDLMRKNPPPHLYRHELESWLYILIWAAAHYKRKDNNSKNMMTKQPQPSLDKWNGQKMDNVHAHKQTFITTGSVARDVYKELLPAFDAVVREWIEPLRKIFRRAHASSEDASDNGDVFYDYETCNGELTFQNFMATIKITSRNVYLPSN